MNERIENRLTEIVAHEHCRVPYMGQDRVAFAGNHHVDCGCRLCDDARADMGDVDCDHRTANHIARSQSLDVSDLARFADLALSDDEISGIIRREELRLAILCLRES